MVENASTQEAADSLSLSDFIGAIKRRSRILWGSILLGLVLGCVYMIVTKPLYTVTMVVGPAPSSSGKVAGTAASSLSSASSALSGILGTTTSPTQIAPMDEFMQLILSPRVAQQIIDKDPTVLQTFFAKQWDPVKKEWHPPLALFPIIQRSVYAIFGLPGWSKPSAQTLATYLVANLTIAEVSTTAMQTISINVPKPAFGVAFFKHLRSEADLIVRQEAQDLADKQIDYLQQKLNQTQQLDQRQMLLGLLQSQVMTRMSINSSLPYAATIIQQPIASDLPTSPNPFIVLTIAVIVGFLLGVFFAMLATLIWPNGIPRMNYSHRYLIPARRALEYFLTVPENVRSNVN